MAGPSPALTASLNPREQMVLAGFLAGRLPAGQVHAQLARARAVAEASVAAAVVPAPPAQPAPARRLRPRLAA
jgi:hypothetical protein